MEALSYALSGLAVAGIYCVYSHYVRDRMEKLSTLRRRVTYMLWKASRKARYAAPDGSKSCPKS